MLRTQSWLARSSASGFSSPRSAFQAHWSLSLDHVIKDHPRVGAPGDRLVVWRFGGKRRDGDIVVREAEVGFPSFKIGERFLLSLRWNESLNRWSAGVSYHTLKVDGTS